MLYGFNLPEDFLIGTANSAFQSEGAWKADGKSESIMDHYAVEFGGKHAPTWNPETNPDKPPFSDALPDNGCFFYDNYEAYIEDMAKTGQNTYRMSLAWTRIIPTGVGEVNQKAIDYYNKVINKLLECNITPFVDIYHWDLPQCLMEKGGFANPDFPQWYEDYAKVCFENFGDRVKMWSTFNESAISIRSGYIFGTFPPFINDFKQGLLAAQNVLVAHFRAIRLYRSMKLGGKIGSVNCISPASPVHFTEEDMDAVARSTEYLFGWWLEPMVFGTYPQVLLRECPKFVENMPENYQAVLDKWFTPMDFIGVNYYVSAKSEANETTNARSKRVDGFYSEPGQRFVAYPPGLIDVIQYIATKYHGLDIYITENGCAITDDGDKERELNDTERISYIREHLRNVSRLIRAGYPVKGYYYWNDADSFEELDGYNFRFGLTYVDHETGERTWKKSRYYFSEICKTRLID